MDLIDDSATDDAKPTSSLLIPPINNNTSYFDSGGSYGGDELLGRLCDHVKSALSHCLPVYQGPPAPTNTAPALINSGAVSTVTPPVGVKRT